MHLETAGAGARLTDVARSRPSFPRPPLVLVVDDQEWSARSLESVLGASGFAALRLPSARRVLEQLPSLSPDLLMIKADLPERSGVELCTTLRSTGAVDPTTPILITSAAPPTREQRLDALRAGAWEAIALPLGAEELLLKLHVYVRAKLEVDRMREECLLDAATGMYSVQGMLRRIEEVGLDAARHHRPVSCAVIAPEDQLPGESAGPQGDDDTGEVPGRMAHLISSVARRSDVVGRVGRTEFAVLAPGTDPTGILALARRFVNAGELPVRSRSGTAPLQLRVGCYGVDDFGDSFVGPADLLTRAMSALRSAQCNPGGPPVCFFDPVAPVA